MSRRYGRNQKRRAREALATAKVEIEGVTLRLLSELERNRKASIELERLQFMLGDIESMLPSGSPLIEPELMAVKTRAKDALEIPIYLTPVYPVRFPSILDETEEVAYARAERLHAAVCSYMESRHDIGAHFYVDFMGETVAYACTRPAFNSMPRGRLHRYLKENIADQMVTHLLKSMK